MPQAPDSTLVRTGLAGRYAPGFPAHDEMVETDGSLRPHWRPLVSMLDDLGPAEVLSRADHARRLIRENGITHNVYDAPEGPARPWNLDLLPLPLPASQWNAVAEGLTQRAKLLNALLAEVYSPASTIVPDFLPAELVCANAGFLRPCHGLKTPRNQWLHLYAADLVRGPDGGFHVLSDRTQAPSGAGYAVENRIVLTRVLATVFGQCNVLRLAPFFITLRQSLVALAPPNVENPRVVLLTPGPYNETYFEQAYLARYLGYTLVQGKDLTVRDCRVYLKTLSGLQRVDVILRRVDDDYCDPLELYSHSFLGVPGLLQAARDGTVAIANALGSGFAQAPALLPFLPALCKHFLGEELKLPSIQTWWCGQAQSLQYVLENIKSLVIKPAFPTRMSDPVFGDDLSSEELAELRLRIAAKPYNFVAQEPIASFTAPVFANGEVQPRRMVVRANLAASGDSYAVLPGGLARVTRSPDSMLVSLQKGGASKDTWILADGPVGQVTLLGPSSAPVKLSRGGSDLPSRVADDLFWLGRYVQRADSSARLARCVFNRMSDLNAIDSPRAMKLLVADLVGPKPKGPLPTNARELAAEMFSERDPFGLRSSARHFNSLVRVLRDRVSGDAWRILQSIHRDLSEFHGKIDDDQATVVIELLNKLVAGFLAFGGMAAESMTRGQSWRFMDMGLRVERGIAAARLVRFTLVDQSPEEPFLLEAVLEAADSALSYRRRYASQLQAPAVVDLLIADATNPRAVAFQLKAIEEHLAALPRESNHPQWSPDLQLIIKLQTMIRLADLPTVCQPVKGRRGRLNALLTDTMENLASASELVSQIYFTHAVAVAQLVADQQEVAT